MSDVQWIETPIMQKIINVINFLKATSIGFYTKTIDSMSRLAFKASISKKPQFKL